MNITRGRFLQGVLAGAIAAALFAGCKTGSGNKHAAKLSLTGRQALDIATEAYIYGYPLVRMDMTRRVMTNVRYPEGTQAPLGQFARVRTYPPASNHDATTPNADTLYTGLWLDVAKEPWVVSLPDAHDRYCLFPMLDGWTTVFQSPGKRTTGTGPQKYVITGPGWKGKLPSHLKEYKSPTSIVWVLGRISCTGTTEDYAAVHSIQDQCSAVPLSSYGKPYVPQPGPVDPSLDMTTPVREQVNNMDAATFFNRLALLMKDNPPMHADAPIIKKMARLGIVPGHPFNLDRFDPAVIQVLQNLPKLAQARIMAWFKEGTKYGTKDGSKDGFKDGAKDDAEYGTKDGAKVSAKAGDSISQNGWRFSLKTGVYGTDYIQRALIAAIGLGANRPQDIFYAVSVSDGAEQPYSGNFRYVMHFPPGQAPSVNGFWSLTMYDADYFFVENGLGRYSLGSRDGLKFNADGSLDLYIQRHSPGAGLESNWLPAAEEKFLLMLRLYWPKETMLNGSWKIPPVKRGD
jgi:hypothetical protein